jgi:hypothetical protein
MGEHDPRTIVLVLVLVLAIVGSQVGGQPTAANGREEAMAFDHEQLDVYRLASEFVAWTGELLDNSLKKSGLSAARHLDDASPSIVNNITSTSTRR